MLPVPLAALVVALAMGRFCAWLASAHNESGFGWMWALPGVSGVVVCLVLTAAYGRPPRADAASSE
jgi:hypothetical protein